MPRLSPSGARLLTPAALLQAAPLIGDLLGFLVILIVAGAALMAEIRKALNSLFSFTFGQETGT